MPILRTVLLATAAAALTPQLSAQVDEADLRPLAEYYSPSQPQLHTLWNRVADFSPRLRSVEAAEFSPDGRKALSGSKFGYNVMAWSVVDGSLLWEAKHDSEVECVTWSPDGATAVSGGEDYFVRTWDGSTGEPGWAVDLGVGLDGIAHSNDGSLVVAGAENGEAIFLDAATGQERGRVDVGSTINSLHFTRDDAKLIVAGNIQTPGDGPGGKIYTGFTTVLDVPTMTVAQEFGEVAGSVKSVRWSPDETMFATAGFDRTARLYDAASGDLVREFTDSLNLEAVEFTPDGQYLVTGGHGTYLKWWRLADGSLALTQPSARVEYIDFTDDNRLMLIGSEDSGLLSCYLLESDVQARGTYQNVADEQLSNRDLQGGRE